MQSNLFSLNLDNVRSALVTGVLTALLAVIVYIIGVGDVFAIDYKTLINIAFLAGLNSIVSLLKNFLTNNQGEFVGVAQVK